MEWLLGLQEPSEPSGGGHYLRRCSGGLGHCVAKIWALWLEKRNRPPRWSGAAGVALMGRSMSSACAMGPCDWAGKAERRPVVTVRLVGSV